MFLINQGYTYKSFYNKGTAQELILYGYLKAMDNYFDVKEALAFSNRAAKLNPNSYAIAIINQLIKVQTLSQNKWCEVYRLMNKIRDNKKMTNDFRKEASDIIFKYTDIYKTDCSN